MRACRNGMLIGCVRILTLTLVVVWGLGSTSASAQPQEPEQSGKSPAAAFGMSVGITLAGFGVIVIGVANDSRPVAAGGVALAILGPSAGHLYAGAPKHAAVTTLIRTAGFIALMAGVIQLDGTSCDSMDDNCRPSSGQKSAGKTIAWLGGITYVGAMAYAFVDSSRVIKERNARGRRTTIVPSMISTNAGLAPAVAVSGRF